MPTVVAGLPASKGAHAKHSTRYANLCMFQVSEPHAASTLEPSQLAAQMGPNTGRLDFERAGANSAGTTRA